MRVLPEPMPDFDRIARNRGRSESGAAQLPFAFDSHERNTGSERLREVAREFGSPVVSVRRRTDSTDVTSRQSRAEIPCGAFFPSITTVLWRGFDHGQEELSGDGVGAITANINI